MRRRVLAVVLVAFAAGWAHGAPISFTFDDGALADGDGDIKLSLYMSSLNPPLMLVNGAQVHSGDGFGADHYLWTRSQLLGAGNLLIGMVIPTTSVSFDGYIFDATSGADFAFTAYNLTGQIIYQQTWNTGSGTGFFCFTGPFSQPVYLLKFSNSGQHDIGIDNLTLNAIPAPGAGLLVMAGTALVGYLRRRRTL
jgi:hypothetical protein